MSGTPFWLVRSTTFRPSVPWSSDHSVVGATSESTVTGGTSDPTTFDFTVVMMCRYSTWLELAPHLGSPPRSSVIHFASDEIEYLTPSTVMSPLCGGLR